MAEEIVPVVFRKSPEFVQSYSFQELLTGLGIEVFNCFNSTDSIGNNYLITDSTISPYSSVGEFSEQKLATSNDFEMAFGNYWETSTFNYLKTLIGKSYLRFSHVVSRGSGGSDAKSCQYYLILKLKKLNLLAAEEDICSVQTATFSKTLNPNSYGDTLNETLFMEIPITNLKSGEKLRLYVEGWIKQVSTGTFYPWGVVIGNDPSNTSSAHITSSGRTTTKLEFTLPFKVSV
jgi:hypothetical protein